MLIENESFISAKKLAAILNVKVSLIYKYVKTGRFHKDIYIRFGPRKILFRVSRLDKYLFPQEVDAHEELERMFWDVFRDHNNKLDFPF